MVDVGAALSGFAGPRSELVLSLHVEAGDDKGPDCAHCVTANSTLGIERRP